MLSLQEKIMQSQKWDRKYDFLAEDSAKLMKKEKPKVPFLNSLVRDKLRFKTVHSLFLFAFLASWFRW